MKMAVNEPKKKGKLRDTPMEFGEAFRILRLNAGKSRYKLAQYTGLNEAYLSRLERGLKTNPSREAVMLLALALVQNNQAVSANDIDLLLLSAGYAPLRRRAA